MKKLQTLLLSCSVSVLAACAGQTYRADVGAMFAFANGDIALQNAAGSLDLGSNQNNLENNMGLADTEVSPYVRLQMDKEKHRVRFLGFRMDAEGSGTLAGGPGTGDFGDIPGGTPVTTSMEFLAINANYAYEVLRSPDYRIGLGLQLAYYALDVAARSASGREEVQTDALVPYPFIEIEGFARGGFTGGANASLMALDVGDGSGRYWDAEAYVRWEGTIDRADIDVMVGYRYILLDAYGNASGRDFDADIDVNGVFISAGIRF